MQCPNCDFDFRESENKKSFYTQQNEHFGKPYKVNGYVCGNCGFHVTMLHIPIKSSFFRTARTFNELDNIVTEFQEKVRQFYDNRKTNQISMFSFDDEELEIEES